MTQCLQGQCVVVETAAQQALGLPSGWQEMVHYGRVYYLHTVSQRRQWQRPSPEAAAEAHGSSCVLLHVPGYFSGAVTATPPTALHHRCPPLLSAHSNFEHLFTHAILGFCTRIQFRSGEALRLDVCAADDLVRQRVEKIVSVSQSMARCSGGSENAQELQSAFDALFFVVCGACSHLPIEQSLEITRHIMGSSSTSVISALVAAPLSAAAAKALQRMVHAAQAALHI